MAVKKRVVLLLIIIYIAATLSSVAICAVRLKGVLNNNYENDCRVVTGLISNSLDNTFLRPITVAETIAKDYNTKKILMVKDETGVRAVEKEASEYLKSIRDGFGYSMVFAVSDASKAFYTYNGFDRYINPSVYPEDAWYDVFKGAGNDYSLQVDYDPAFNDVLSVFVNTAVYDANNRFIGACGVGIHMTELQKLIKRLERIHNVKINLIDSEGLIMVDSDSERIQRDTIIIDEIDQYADGECYYEILDGSNRTIMYLDDLGWYLVVEHKNVLNSSVVAIVMPGLIGVILGLVFIMLLFKSMDKKQENKQEDTRENTQE